MIVAGLSLSGLNLAAHAGCVNAVDVLASALVSAVWQGGALVCAVALALRLVPGLSAGVRGRLWLAVLAVLVLLPALPFVLPAAVSRRSIVAMPQPLTMGAAWSVWLVCAWAMLSVTRAVKLAAGAVRLRRVAREAVLVEVGAESATLLHHAGRSVKLCVSAAVSRPSVVGFFRPRVLLPPALFAALSPDDLRQVLLHEIEHLRRRDDWSNLAQKLALVALPLHPALFWVERRLCVERELACDDGVLRADGGLFRGATRKAYAACLVSLAEHAVLRRGASLALGAWERQSELGRRVHRILQQPEPAPRPAVARVMIGGLLGGVVAGAVLLAGIPQIVRFAPEPANILASVSNVGRGDVRTDVARALGQHAIVQPVVAHMPPGGSHLTLTTAVLPVPVAGTAKVSRGSRSIAPLSRRAALRSGASAPLLWATRGGRPRGTDVERREPLLRRVAFTAQEQPRLVLLTTWASAAPVLAIAVEAEDNFSRSYAAVPMQGGWLLVQL